MMNEDFTELFKRGSLKDGYYYIWLDEEIWQDEDPEIVFITNDETNEAFNKKVMDNISAVVCEAPTLKQFKALRQSEQENKILKEIIEELCVSFDHSFFEENQIEDLEKAFNYSRERLKNIDTSQPYATELYLENECLWEALKGVKK